MTRYVSNMGLTAKIEATAGTDAAPAAATDGVLLIKGMDVTPLDIKLADRNLLLPYFGGSMQLLANASHKVSFSVELAGGGVAALTTTGAPWGVLMQACACAQAALATPNRIEHTPTSSSLKTATIYVYDDGVLHKLTGAMGTWKLSAKTGDVPRLQFDFIGTYVPLTAVAIPAFTLTAWKQPVPMAKANVVDITLGSTYAAGAITGGTSFGSNGIELDAGNSLQWFTSLSSERAEITDRDSKVSYELELTAAAEVTAMSDMVANNTTSLAITIGTSSGAKILIYLPLIQRTAIKKVDSNGIRMIGFEAKAVPSSGNDEWRLVQL